MDNFELTEKIERVRKMPIGQEQKQHLLIEMKNAKFEKERLLEIFEVNSIDELTIGNYLLTLDILHEIRKEINAHRRKNRKHINGCNHTQKANNDSDGEQCLPARSAGTVDVRTLDNNL